MSPHCTAGWEPWRLKTQRPRCTLPAGWELEPSRGDRGEIVHDRAEGGFERSGRVVADGGGPQRRHVDRGQMAGPVDDLGRSRPLGEIPEHGRDLYLVRVATDGVAVAAED